MINLNEVGAFPIVTPASLQIRFGLYLPGILATDGFDVVVRVIHQNDRFTPGIDPVDFHLTHDPTNPLDLWGVTAPLNAVAGTSFGTEGVYLYRFQLWWTPADGTRQLVTLWFTDPFARQTETGNMAAVTVSGAPSTFAFTDDGYTTPAIDDLIVYELEVEQFNDSFDGVIARLPYLQSLGVNCLELMPVSSPKLDFDWGYGPLHYYAPNAQTGGPDGLRRLVDACHKAGMAVILDVVYQHVDGAFPYKLVYDNVNATAGAPQVASPMINGDGPFGPTVDYTKPFAQDYFAIANQNWLDQYHVDGFRYDEVTDLYDGATGTAYAALAYRTYMYSLGIDRFVPDPAGPSRVIQTAEALGIAPVVLRNTYTSCAWQDNLLNAAESIAGGAAPTSDFAHTLDPYFAATYPATKTVVNRAGANVEMPVAPFQYLNSHDHSHLIVFAGTTGSGMFPMGDRTKLWPLQPLAIALYTCQGVPMLWEGEEFVDDYNLPGDGSLRVNMRRDTHWEYFYDQYGSSMVGLYRRLATLRRGTRALRSRESFYYWQQSLQGNEVVAYHRHAPADAANPEQYAMVVLNFNSSDTTIQLPFPKAGVWTEQIDATFRPAPLTVNVAAAGDTTTVAVPSNYGYVFVL